MLNLFVEDHAPMNTEMTIRVVINMTRMRSPSKEIRAVELIMGMQKRAIKGRDSMNTGTAEKKSLSAA